MLTTDRLDSKTGRSTNEFSRPLSGQGLSCHDMAFNMSDPFQSGLSLPDSSKVRQDVAAIRQQLLDTKRI
jgi:hypothetical protein